MDISTQQFNTASQRMEKKRAQYSIQAVHYDAGTDRLVIALSNGLELSFSPKIIQDLQHATADNLSLVDISGGALAVYFPRLDVSIYLPGLLAGALGTREWMRSELAAQGGKTRSPAKSAAARENGKLGGRPCKKLVA